MLWGQGEMHLKVALDRLAGKYGLSLQTERPKVAYKEAIRKPVSQHARFKKQTGGHGQFGDVHVDVKPLPRGTGFEFHEKVVGGAVPRQYIPAVEAGVRDYLTSGPLGFPVVDVSVTLTDGKHHSVGQLGDGLQDRRPHGNGRSVAQVQPGASGAHLRGQDLDTERVHAERPAPRDRPPRPGAGFPGPRGLVPAGTR